MGMNTMVIWVVFNFFFKLFSFQGKMMVQHTSLKTFKNKNRLHKFESVLDFL